MAKKLTVVAALLVMLFSLTAHSAFAGDNVLGAYIGKYDNDSGTFSEKLNRTFAWNIKPFLYVFGRFSKVVETWISPSGNEFTFNVADNGAKDYYSAYDGEIVNHLPDWASNKEDGIWSWSVQALKNGSGVGDVVTGQFTVKPLSTPEPISTTLFLLGGAALGANQLRKKNKKS